VIERRNSCDSCRRCTRQRDDDAPAECGMSEEEKLQCRCRTGTAPFFSHSSDIQRKHLKEKGTQERKKKRERKRETESIGRSRRFVQHSLGGSVSPVSQRRAGITFCEEPQAAVPTQKALPSRSSFPSRSRCSSLPVGPEAVLVCRHRIRSASTVSGIPRASVMVDGDSTAQQTHHGKERRDITQKRATVMQHRQQCKRHAA